MSITDRGGGLQQFLPPGQLGAVTPGASMSMGLPAANINRRTINSLRKKTSPSVRSRLGL